MPYYAVKKGHNVGIYSTWGECEQQTKGYKNAVFRKFDTTEEAHEFINGTLNSSSKVNNIAIDISSLDPSKTIYVDGAFNKKTGNDAWGSVVNGYSCDLIRWACSQGLLQDMEVKEVTLPKGKRWIIVAKFERVTHQNNGAELLALIAGLRMAIHLIKNNVPITTVLSDSELVLFWSIRLKDESAATFDPRKVYYIHELIKLRKEYESYGGKVEKVNGDFNPADLGYHTKK